MRFNHQQTEYDKFRYSPARALLWQMRTGKSMAVIECAEALEDIFEINGVLVVAPNGIHRQWAEIQIPYWYHKNVSAFSWRFSNKNNQRDFAAWVSFLGVRKWLHWFCVNMEAIMYDEVQEAIRMFKRAVGPAMLVGDEVHHFASPKAKRTGVMRGLGRMFEYKRVLTGTAIENSPLQSFSEFEILERAALGHTTYGGTNKKSKSRVICPTCGVRCRGFKNEFGVYEPVSYRGRMVIDLVEYKNLDVLKTRMAKYSSVVLREDCEDLPPIMKDVRLVEMTPKQQEWWDAARDQALDDIDRLGQGKVFDGGAALVKLQQIEGGFWLHEQKHDAQGKKLPRKVEDLCGNDNPKILILLDEITLYDGQVVVWFEYLHEIDAVLAFLKREGIKCGVFSGRAVNRDRDLADFTAGKVRLLLAQSRAGGEGRDMSVAKKILWYSHTPDAVVRNQSNERATKMGGDSVQLVDILGPTGKYYVQITDDKTTLADDVSRRGLKKVLQNLR